MTLRRTILTAGLAVASLAVLAACGTTPAPAAAPAPAPVSQAATPTTDSAPTTADVPAAPILARTQGRVQIFEGAAAAPVVPPADRSAGTNNLQLNATNDPQLGIRVTDTTGLSLYRFDKDTANPSTSNCSGACATTWPPLLINSPGKIYTDGVDPSLVGYVERADHTCQVTLNGWPLYYYSKDSQAGDVNGEGVGNTWFAVSPEGTKAAASANSSTGSAPSADSAPSTGSTY